MTRDATMTALVFDSAKDDWEGTRGFRKAEVPRPRLDEARDAEDAGRAILKVIYAGVCGSDRGIWFRTSFKEMILGSLRAEGKSYRVIGHELVGEIVAVGSQARAHYRYGEGDIVAAESHLVCGRCAQCRLGETHVCSDAKIIGISADGGFAEYVKLPADVLWPTDERMIRLEVAAIQEPFGNAVHAATKVDLRGKTVAILGCGTIGLFTVLIARALGAGRIYGVEPNPRNRELALSLGADAVLAPAGPAAGGAPWAADPAVVAALREATGGVGVDVAIEMSGDNGALNGALAATRRGGDVVLFGLRSGDFTIQGMDRVIVNGLTLHSVIGREIFRTWFLTRSLLEDRRNGIQDKIYDVILEGGRGSVVPLRDFESGLFEKAMLEHTKIIIRI